MPPSRTALSRRPASSSAISGPLGSPRSSIAPYPRMATSACVRPSGRVMIAMRLTLSRPASAVLLRRPSGGEPHEVSVEGNGALGPARAAVLVLVALPGLVLDPAGEIAFHEQHELERGAVDP